MFNAINAIILLGSLAGIIFIFFRRFPLKEEGSFDKEKIEKEIAKETEGALEEKKLLDKTLEEWDKAMEKLTEMILRKSRIVFLKGDYLVSKWLTSLKKKNSLPENNNFFEEIIETNNKKTKKKKNDS